MVRGRDKPWLRLVPTPERNWVPMQAVNSSSIAAAGYDEPRRVLRLRYAGGGTYDYRNVPADVFQELLDAQSKGLFVNARIKPFYACSPVR